MKSIADADDALGIGLSCRGPGVQNHAQSSWGIAGVAEILRRVWLCKVMPKLLAPAPTS